MLKQDQAEKILQGNIKNIIQKVTDGKPLTPHELKHIGSFSDEKQLAKSVVELSNKLGVSRQSIYNWQKSPDAPKNLNISEWTEFIEKKESTTDKGSGRVAVGGRHWTAQEIIDLKAMETQERHKRQIAERKLRELELKKLEENWVPIAEAKQVISKVTNTIHRLLENFPKRYASKLDPKNAETVEVDLRECVNETLRQLQVDAKKWVKG